MLKIEHDYSDYAGFFSCCSTKICKIILYYSTNKTLPEKVDSSRLFDLYKTDQNIDITYDFFENYDNIHEEIELYKENFYINISAFQYDNYKDVDYTYIVPFVKKYFTPSIKIKNNCDNLVLKYNIDIHNCIGLYYRGTDKNTETQIDTFDSYYQKLTEIINTENDNIQIIIQTDSAQFLDFIKNKCLHNIIIINENSVSYTDKGIHNEKTTTENYIDIQNLFSTFLIISKCKYVICSSSNCSIWMMYYRENADNIYQNLDKVWLNNNIMTELKINHNAGFFSCCSVRLHEIVNYFNNNKTLPDIIDSSNEFNWYKVDNNKDKDITFEYFDHYNNYNKIQFIQNIDYNENYQYGDYSTLDYNNITPFVEKYFSPSLEIKNIIVELEKKYNINYDNICVLFYRGNDKITETNLSSYDEYITYSKELISKNPETILFIQSDESEFIETITNMFPNNSFYMKEEIRHMKKCNNTVDICIRDDIGKFSKFYLAITIIMSKCKFIVCGSGNCSIWIMFYRGNTKNVYQFLNNKWLN